MNEDTKKRFKEYVSKVFGIKDGNRPLYHYTSVDALVNGIIPKDATEGREVKLRLTNSLFLNDEKEIRIGVEFLVSHFKDILQKSNRNFSENDYCKMETDFEQIFGRNFIFSLSTNGDSLPMWNSYSNNGTGIAIEFAPFATSIDYDVLKCEYSKKKWEALINNRNKEEYHLLYGSSLIYIPLLMKHEAFEYEDEVRLVGEFKNIPVEYRTKHGIAIPYKEIYFSKEQITSIKIGPAANQKLVEQSLRRMLDDRGFEHVKIIASEIPYRNI